MVRRGNAAIQARVAREWGDGVTDYRVRIQSHLISELGSGVWLMKQDNRQTFLAKRMEIVWEPFRECFLLPEPTLAVEPGVIKAFASALLENGDLPRDFLMNDRETDAIKKHLEDLKGVNTTLLRIVESKL